MDVNHILSVKNISIRDLKDYHKKQVIHQFLDEKIKHPNHKSDEIASNMDISLRTIQRYQKDLGEPTARRKGKTTEEKREIALKSAETKNKNKVFKEELKQLKSENLSPEDFTRRANEIREKVSAESSKIREVKERSSIKKAIVKSTKAAKGESGTGEETEEERLERLGQEVAARL